MTTIFLSAFAGIIIGCFAGCMGMALFSAGKRDDAEFGPETGTDPFPTRFAIRAQYEQECG